MEFQLPYHKGTLPLHVPDANLSHVLTNRAEEFKSDRSEADIVRDALAAPIGTPKLRELATGKNKIMVITSDHTRSMPSGITMPILLEEIRAGAPDAEITIMIATGLHRAMTHQEQVERFGAELVEKERIVVHNAFAADEMRYVCKLPSGADLSINYRALESDLIVSEGFIEPHFFAGFSGGRKSILPGIASQETVNENHSAKAIASPYAATGVLKGNPIHEDMDYAARKVGLAFILNVAMDAEKHIVAAFAGDCVEAHAKGCAFVSDMCGVDKVQSDIVITTNSGYPLDQNLYQTPKGVSTAAACAAEGAVLILGASLCDGIGGTNFEKLMRLGSAQKIKETVEAIPPKESIPEQWCAQTYAKIMLQYTVIIVTQHMDLRELESMGFLAFASFDEALEKAFELKGRDASVTVIPDGVSVIVRS
ncbi:MAG: nickel-dependent lactate racemase [Oscillibacter sp.]|nr:nickel-dependent lactate racemase [Oscillibacter sp.]